jgi:hypothetical protein
LDRHRMSFASRYVSPWLDFRRVLALKTDMA